MKLEKALDAFSDDKPEETQARKRKQLTVNHVTGYNQGLSDAIISRADDIYVAKTP